MIIIEESPEPNGAPLIPVDVAEMCRRNADLMETLVQETIQKIYNTYMKYRDRIDVFYVAFSGGKDSVVTLDLVQRALPHDQFIVVFSDTGMEFSDTYKIVDRMKKRVNLKISVSIFPIQVILHKKLGQHSVHHALSHVGAAVCIKQHHRFYCYAN